MLKNPKVAARANGLKALVNILLEPKYVQYHDGIIGTILLLLDDKETRKYFRVEYDLQPIVSSFTQLVGKDTKLPFMWESSGRIICKMMRTWSGFIALNHNGLAIKALTESLMIQDSPERVDKILDTVTVILSISSPEEFKYMIPKLKDGLEIDLQDKLNNSSLRRFSMPVQKRMPRTDLPSSSEPSMTQTFFACIILSFFHSGLVEVLHDLSEKGEYPRAAKLFQVFLALSDRFIPSDICLKMHDEFDSEYSLEMNQLYSSGNQKKAKKTLSILTTFYHHSKSLFKQRNTHYLKVENVKTKIDTAMDDTQYQNLINQSSVLKEKNFQKWDWNSISALIYGPLRAPLRISEMITNKITSKFCKRVLGYFKPFKKGAFAELNIQDGMIYTDLCCQLLENLLACSEGVDLIKSSNFIHQLKEIIEIETLPNPDSRKDRVLSEVNFTLKLPREYFRIIGKLSSISQGVSLLEEYGVFGAMEAMIKSGKRDEIVQTIIQNLDYSLSNSNLNQFSKNILKTAVNSSKKNIRNFVVLRVKQLMKENKKIDFQKMGIELIYSHITLFEKDDPSSTTSLQILESICRSPENLDILISLHPDVSLFEKKIEGRDLLLRMLSRESGINYLCENKWTERSLKEWKEKTILEYSLNIEISLKKAFNDRRNRQIDLDPNRTSEYVVLLSPHFYGEICKTKAGCEYIQKTGHLTEFFQILDSPTSDKTLKRAIFWTLGFIGSSDTGYDFIDGDKYVEKLVSYCEKSHCLSLRGLCMYVLTEMSKSTKARKKLEKLGWDSVIDPDNSSVISLPKDPTSFLSIPEYEYEGSYTDFTDEYTLDEKDLPPMEGEIENNILYQLSRLANALTEEKAFLEIKNLRKSYLSKFNSKEMICRIFYMLDKYKFSKKSRNGVFYPLLDVNGLDIQMPFDYLDSNYNKK